MTLLLTGIGALVTNASGVPGDLGGQHLDRHVAAELAVPGPIHLAHAAGAERLEDLVRA